MSRSFRPSYCGDLRVPAGISGSLLRDARGMDSLPNAGCVRGRLACQRMQNVPGASPLRREDARAREASATRTLASEQIEKVDVAGLGSREFRVGLGREAQPRFLGWRGGDVELVRAGRKPHTHATPHRPDQTTGGRTVKLTKKALPFACFSDLRIDGLFHIRRVERAASHATRQEV